MSLESHLADIEKSVESIRRELSELPGPAPSVVTPVVAGAGPVVPPAGADGDIVAGPDADGRVKFRASVRYFPNLWLFSPLTLKAGLVLTERQVAGVVLNVSCDDKGNLQSNAPGFRYLDGAKFAIGCRYPVQKANGWFRKGTQWVGGEPYVLRQSELTFGSRHESIDELVEGLINEHSTLELPNLPK